MKTLKVIVTTLICIFMLYSSSNISYAKTLGEIMKGGDVFINADNNVNKTVFDKTATQTGTTQLYFIALGVGVMAMVIMGIIIGIQFITTGAEGQAKVKEKLLPYAIGCVVIFGAFGIWRLVINIVQDAVK